MPAKTQSTNTKTHARSPLRIYFLLMTMTGVIGTLITLGILIFSVAKKVIITDQEYIISERYYELDSCNNPILKPMMGQVTTVAQPTTTPTETYVQPTDTEKEKCKADKTVQLIAGRSATLKTDVLGGAIRSILFLTLLLTHYPRFIVRQTGKSEM